MPQDHFLVPRCIPGLMILLAVTSSVHAAEPDPLLRAVRAHQAGQHLYARKLLTDFIGSSIGDKRLGRAGELLRDTYSDEAGELARNGRYILAADEWIDAANYFEGTEFAKSATVNAQEVLTTSYTAARRKKDVDEAIVIAGSFKRLFPDEKPLLNMDEIRSLWVESLAAGWRRKDRPEMLFDRMGRAFGDGVTEQDLVNRGINPVDLRIDYARTLIDEGGWSTAISLLSEWKTLARGKDRAAYSLPLEKTLLARAELFASFGNVAMLEHAVGEAERIGVGGNMPKLNAIKRTLDLLRTKTPAAPHRLQREAPLTGSGVWEDDGAGYTIDGELRVKDANIQVMPGFVLDGGTIRTQRGTTFDLHGNADRPIIFRNVTIELGLGDTLRASYTLFENCQFRKSEGYYVKAFSTHWYF